MSKPPKQSIFQISILVREYDEAIRFYCGVLGFTLLEDSDLGGGKRWVRVAPSSDGCALLLAQAKNSEEVAAIGNQSGGRVFLFMKTDDFWGAYDKLVENKVQIHGVPREEPYGTVVVFQDIYGNKWDLIQPK